MPRTTADIDLVIAMGGPMSVNDETAFPWLVDEKRFVRQAVDAGLPVLGICLGAQLIASALGARVYPNAAKEIGWFPVRAAADEDDGVFRFPQEFTSFHWHGETFDLPPGARHLAESDGCRHQAFSIGRHVMGVQFHPEMTASGACLLVEHCAMDLTPGRYVQTRDAILSTSAMQFADGHRVMDQILDYIVLGAARQDR
jgi:GMP synthase-like glutamine amidotransferase